MEPKRGGHSIHSTTCSPRYQPSEGSLRNGARTSKYWPNISHRKKVLTLYGKGGPTIVPPHTLVLDATVRDKVLIKNITPEYVQPGFNNGNAVNQHLERTINTTNEEEITKIAPIPSYFIYDGFEKDLDEAMVYKRLMDSTETSGMYSHVLTFLRLCMIEKWGLNDAKPSYLNRSSLECPPPDARWWSQSRFKQIFPTQNMGMEVHQCPTPTGSQKIQQITNRYFHYN